jgi:hypothetical protein
MLGKHANAKAARDRAGRAGLIIERKVTTGGRPALVYLAPDHVAAWDATNESDA